MRAVTPPRRPPAAAPPHGCPRRAGRRALPRGCFGVPGHSDRIAWRRGERPSFAGIRSGGGMAETRIEKDSLGTVEVPAGAYYGAQTERARRNFPISGLRLPRRFIAALGAIKREAA